MLQEWEAMLFHEQPQEPVYVDGEIPGAGHLDDHMVTLFLRHDTNQDGHLDKSEIFALVKDVHKEDIEKTVC